MKAQVLTSDALDQKELPKVLTAADGVGLGGKIASKESAGRCMLDMLQHDSAKGKPSPAETAHSVAASRS